MENELEMDYTTGDTAIARRPLKSRQTRWAAQAAEMLARLGATPNQISVLSVVMASLGAACLVLFKSSSPGWRAPLLLGAAAFIQLRLACNLLDGLVAIEGGLKTPSGEVFNELPDRISDVAILVAAGYSLPFGLWGRELGWAAALAAVTTAYVRAFGGSVGLRQDFCGPMAKQHRMAVMTVACLLGAAVEASQWDGGGMGKIMGLIAADVTGLAMALGLGVILCGSLMTIARRTRRIVKGLEGGRK
jgi:phosphatidylglycerophosphate synthase